jgi:Family of unknown function (DUF5690)
MMQRLKEHISKYIAAQPIWAFTLFASLAAFFTYSCMYAFRKPFAVGTFNGHVLLGVHYKIWMITAQVIGYTISKFIGIRFISEMTRNKRALSILILVGLAEFSLLLVYLVPPPYNFIFMFFNGLPLGLIWGLVFAFLEGRQTTEILGAILCASFIIASGFVKSVGEFLIVHFNINEFLMPFLTGLIFLIPMIIFVYLLDTIPAPTAKDEQFRSKRAPMDKFQRQAFLNKFFIGIVFLIVAYTFLTIFREMRDNFANEIWTSLGLGKNPAIFTLSELPVAIITLASLGLVAFIKHNFIAFNVILFIILLGFILIIGASVLFYLKLINGVAWMISIGVGLYIGYVPFNAFLYERMISSFRVASNIGFVMYLSDAFGYLGSIGVVFIKNFFSPSISWVKFFVASGIWVSVVGIVLIIGSIIYFNNKYKYFIHLKEEVNGFAGATRKSVFTVDTGTPVYK